MLSDNITFKEDRCANYAHRTWINAECADATLAFAVDHKTSGEICTQKACKDTEHPIFKFQINERGKMDADDNMEVLTECIAYLKSLGPCGVNIAGNGMSTFARYDITQERVDELVYNALKYIKEQCPELYEVRSGGQTGADESGLKASARLGLTTVCFAPKGWRFRTADGVDHNGDFESFKRRFYEQKSK